jgi:3-oxoacyl-[acyl-carrier-protein] synthase-1/3-oxoacyl-[acyl-carrier-protein] synthase II
MSAGIVAFGAVSAMGEGESAVSAGTVGERARVCITRDEVLAHAGLARPFAARAFVPAGEDAATAMLQRAAMGCMRQLDGCIPSWRSLRIGLALGTSSGGMQAAERLLAASVDPDAPSPSAAEVAKALYFAPMLDVFGALGVELAPATLVMGACAASTLSIGLGLRWLDADACDLVLVGGFDAVSTLVAAGFEVLRATTATPPPRPFRSGRDGMALGEGAAVVALRSSRLAPGARVHVTGFAAASDAIHLTAPDRTGRGLATAAKGALAEAGLTAVDLVSPHGSATPFSDAAEAHALAIALPDTAREVVVHPFKAQIGHTLGASGVLETLACADALGRGVYPAAAGEGEIDPEAHATLLDVTRAGSPRTALKLSAAFGGANAALVLSRDAPRSDAPRTARTVYMRRAVHVATLPAPAELATRVGWPIERTLRAEPLARWVLAAVAELVARDGPLAGAGILVGESFATLETNASFFARIQARGTRMAEPRKFPYTSPNAAGGDAGVAFGLTGLSFAVGSGMHSGVEALVVGAHLVAAGDVETLVVVAADDVGPTVARMAETLGVEAVAGAVGVVLSARPEGAVARVVRATCGLGRQRALLGKPTCGHRALLPLVGAIPPGVIAGTSPPPLGATGGTTGWARIDLAPLPEI